MKHLMKSQLAAIVIAVGTVTAHAAPIITFGTGFGGAGGTVSVDNPNGTFNVRGGGIFIDTVTVSGAPGNNGVFDVEGAGVCGDAIGGCGILSFDFGLNIFALEGSIPELGIVTPLPLLTSPTFFQALREIAQDRDGVRLRASENDLKAAELLVALGLDPATTFKFDLSVTGVNGQSPYLVTSTQLTNTPGPLTTVPEPGSLLLLGTGLVGVARVLGRNHGH